MVKVVKVSFHDVLFIWGLRSVLCKQNAEHIKQMARRCGECQKNNKMF